MSELEDARHRLVMAKSWVWDCSRALEFARDDKKAAQRDYDRLLRESQGKEKTGWAVRDNRVSEPRPRGYWNNEAPMMVLPPAPAGWRLEKWHLPGVYVTERLAEPHPDDAPDPDAIMSPWRKVYASADGRSFTISENEVWIPGEYASLEEAIAAFDATLGASSGGEGSRG